MEINIDNVYKGCKIVGAGAVYVSGHGWVSVSATTKEDALSFLVGRCAMGDVEKICFRLENDYGHRFSADFSLGEAKNYA